MQGKKLMQIVAAKSDIYSIFFKPLFGLLEHYRGILSAYAERRS